MNNPDSIFTVLKNLLINKLIPLGYSLGKGEFQSSFGSSYIDFQLNNKIIRLIWDGRESRFCLEDCDEMQNYRTMQHCKYLVDLPFDKHNQNEDATASLLTIFEVVISGLNDNNEELVDSHSA
jgi:hypothetical protein